MRGNIKTISAKPRRETPRCKSFTLFELIVTLVILTVLILAVLPLIPAGKKEAQDARIKNDIESMRDALIRFKVDTGRLPRFPSDLLYDPGIAYRGWDGPYIDRTVDPCGNPYLWSFRPLERIVVVYNDNLFAGCAQQQLPLPCAFPCHPYE